MKVVGFCLGPQQSLESPLVGWDMRYLSHTSALMMADICCVAARNLMLKSSEWVVLDYGTSDMRAWLRTSHSSVLEAVISIGHSSLDGCPRHHHSAIRLCSVYETAFFMYLTCYVSLSGDFSFILLGGIWVTQLAFISNCHSSHPTDTHFFVLSALV